MTIRQLFTVLCMSPQPQMQNSRSLARQQREQALLKLAQQILRQDGFAGLTMDRLTAVSDVSKGTLYNHFSSKEDVLTALSVDSLERLQQLFQLALSFSGHSRERALALHYAYQRFSAAEPTLFLCLLTAATPGVMEKSSVQRLQRRQQLETELLTSCQSVLSEALADGSLTLPAGTAVEEYAFINWAMAFGCNALFTPLRQLGLFAGLEAGQVNIHSISLLFDGMGWLPLTADWDYQASWQRINQMFSQRLATAGSDSFTHPMLSNAQEPA